MSLEEPGRITFLTKKSTIRDFKVLAAKASMSLSEYFAHVVWSLNTEEGRLSCPTATIEVNQDGSTTEQGA